MATKGLTRYIRMIFDRDSAKKVQSEMEATLKQAGDKGGDAWFREIKKAYDKARAQLREQFAAGTISANEYKRSLEGLDRAYNQNLIANIKKARAEGKLTDAEYKKLTNTLKGVGTTGGKAAGLLHAGFAKVVGVLGGFYLFNRIRQFGVDSVKAAGEAGAIWNRLGGILDTVGIKYGEVEKEIRANARAMQDATVVGDEEYATILYELIGISGDYAQSLRAIPVVADFAASGLVSLETATTLVGKAMMGQTDTLSRYGIVVEKGADAVEVLRQKFAGMAANEIKTFAGQLKQLNNEWGDFKEAVGDAIIEAGGGVSVMQTLIGTVKGLTRFVEENHETLNAFAKYGIGGVVLAFRAFWEIVSRVSQLISGVMFSVLSGLAAGFSWVAEATALATSAKAKFYGLFNKDWARQAAAEAQGIRDQAKAMREWAAAADETARASFGAAFGRSGGKPAPLNQLPPAYVPPGTPPPKPPGAPETPEEREKRLKAEWKAIDDRIWVKPGLAGTKQETDAEKLARISIEGNLVDPNDLQLEELPWLQPEKIEPLAERAAEAMTGPWGRAMQYLEEQALGAEGILAQLAEAWANGGLRGLARYAAGQVQYHVAAAISAAAEGLRSLVFGNPVGAALAGKEAALHGAAAGAWKVLAHNAGVGARHAEGGGASGLGGASNAGGGIASRAEPKGEVNIYLVGPGFDALNPQVQQVVAGALQEHQSRTGPNANVRIHRRPS